MSARRRYDRQGLLAINPQAFFELYLEAPERSNVTEGDVEVVRIQGPLEQYEGACFDSYEAILERVDLACESAARTIVLRIDSPGGIASGMTDTARAIRAKCDAAGKRLISYVDGQACSAAYALACAAREVVASETGILGSIGVISCRVDVTEQDKLLGQRFAIVTSGERKSDGHPHSAISESELASTQRIVDSLALTFYDLVEELRGVSRADVAALEAGLFHGASAKQLGLADQVQSFSGLLAMIAGAQTVEGNPMSKKYDEARAALGELAGGEGEEATKARKALTAMDDVEEKPDAAEGDEEKPDAAAEGDEEKPDAASDAPPADDDEEKKKDEAKASARSRATVSASTAGALAAHGNDLAARVARLEAQNEALQRREFLGSRPDLAPGLVKVLDGKPLAEVRAIVNAIPAPRMPKLGDRAAAASVAPTHGKDAGTPSRLPPAEKAALDAAMGLSAKQSIGVEKSAHLLVLGAPVDARKGA
jgi:ClpP class serine protease